MVKQLVAAFLCVFAAVGGSVPPEEPVTGARASILIERETGQVLYEHNADERLPIASVTKIMTLLITAQEINAGNLTFEETAVCSDYAGSMDGSVIWLEKGEEMSVGDLIKSVVIASANDACVMLAEHIAGSESAFVERMNKTAAELKMTNTNFMNCVGYDHENHYSTARDIAVMAGELRKYDYFDEFLLTRLDSVRTGTKRETQLLNTNKLITSYSGITGLKTGTTDGAGCCLCATAKRGNMSLIAVVLGCKDDEQRFTEAEKLLDTGFDGFEKVILRPDTSELVEVAVDGGVKKTVDTRFSGVSDVVLEKGTATEIDFHYSRTEKISAPVEQGQTLGFVTMLSGDEIIGSAKIVAAEKVEALDYGKCLSEIFGMLFTF